MSNQSKKATATTAAVDRKRDLLIMGHRQTFRCARGIAAVLIFTFAALVPVRAASAVAVAIDSRTGKWNYGYWQGGDSEKDAKNRAIRMCKAMESVTPKILASTSRRGFGAIVIFETTDKKPRFAVSLGANAEQQAIREALQKAKAAGGRYARVIRTWNDTRSKSPGDVIKL